jgi:hypothetical protein
MASRLGRAGRRRRQSPKPTGGGPHAVADPRVDGHPKSVQLGVRPGSEPAPCVKGDMSVGTGPYAVADPRMEGVRASTTRSGSSASMSRANAVAGPGGPAGGQCVADPRMPPAGLCEAQIQGHAITMRPARAVIGASTTGDGAFAVADPQEGRDYLDNAGSLRRRSVEMKPSWFCPRRMPRTITGAPGQSRILAKTDLDVDPVPLPSAKDRLVCRIVSARRYLAPPVHDARAGLAAIDRRSGRGVRFAES